MAITNLLSKYRSFSRPSIGKSTGGTYSTYAKQQVAAEDKIIDNQYEAGQLSPEAYLSQLQIRASRTGVTPVAQVNLQEKMRTVQEKVNDSTVSSNYQAGKLTTQDVLDYEKSKLSKMTEPGSSAYLQQSQKIQQLTDKAEREARTALRTEQIMKISKMPDDSSKVAWEKAKLYKQLSDQARLDGDIQQADSLKTQSINYESAAKKADINDQITQARLLVSGTAGAGLGTPSAEGGLSRLTSPSSIQGGVTGGEGRQGTASSPVTTGFSGIKNSAVNNALESLDRKYKSYERTAQEINDTNTMIEAYNKAIASSEGDQKTQLTIALNNLVESKNNKSNQLSILEEGINESVVRIQEIQAKAAAGAFSQEVRKNNQLFDRAETDLEKAFSSGEITKDEYIQKGVSLAATKTQFYGQASDVFNQYGNDSSAQSYLDKASQMEDIHQSLIGVAENINDYEPIMVDPTGKITNLLGKNVNPGEITLTNVRQLKDSGDFESNYTNDNGVYKRVFYPGVKGDLDGGYVSKGLAESLAKESTSPDKSPFVYGKSTAPGGVGPVTGEVKKQPLTKTTTGQWVTPSTFNTMKKTANDSLDKVLGKNNQTQQLIDQTKKDMGQPKINQPSFLDRVLNPSSSLQPATKKDNVITSGISSIGNNIGNWFNQAKSGISNLFNSAKDRVATATKNINLPNLVPKAYASDKSSDSGDIESIIKSVFPREQWDNALRVAMGESSMNPLSINSKNTNKSIDYGLFQINSIHLPWIKNKYGWTEKDLNDPVKNTIIAKEIYDRNKGWSPWVAANKQGISGYTPAPTPKPEDVLSRNPQVAGVSTYKPPVSTSNGPYLVDKTQNTTSLTRVPVAPVAPSSNIQSFIPKSININPPTQIAPSNIGEALSNAYQNIKTDISRISLPKINIQPAIQKVQQIASPVIQRVQDVAKPVTNFVSNAVNSVKNTLSNLFKRK